MHKRNLIFLRLNDSQIAALKEIARNAYPNESVALLFGQVERKDYTNTMNDNNNNINNKSTKNDEKRYYFMYTVQKIDECKSSEPSPIDFVLGDFESLAQKWIQAESMGLKFNGIFHSHPVNAHYSRKDETYMAEMSQLYPNIAWLIYGNKRHDFRCFLFIKGKVHEIKVECPQ